MKLGLAAGIVLLLGLSAVVFAFSNKKKQETLVVTGSQTKEETPKVEDFNAMDWREADALFENVTVGNIRNQQEFDVAALRNYRQGIWNKALAQVRTYDLSSKEKNRLGMLVQGREKSGLDATQARQDYAIELERLNQNAEVASQIKKDAKTKMYALDRIINLVKQKRQVPQDLMVTAGLV